MDNIEDRIFYDSACKPKRKDHREKHLYWCKLISEKAQGICYFNFYKTEFPSERYVSECLVKEYQGYKQGTRRYTYIGKSCLEGLRDINRQMRNML